MDTGGYRMRKKQALLLPLVLLMLAAGCMPEAGVMQRQGLGWQGNGSKGVIPAINYMQIENPAPLKPMPIYATIGVTGDIMVMQSQIRGAWIEAEQRYDFCPSFAAMRPWFAQADFLLGNLETPIAGEEAGYSVAKGSGSAAEDSPDGAEPQTFNAPDALAASLAEVGFHALTTANNHCADRGAEGLFRTARILRDTGILQVGTNISQEDSQRPRVAVVNGIRIGLVAWTFGVNGYSGAFTKEQREYAVVRLSQRERIQQEITRCREAGAEFILAYVHWDEEHQSEPLSSTRRLAAWMLEQGVDAVIGAHPHVVQPVEYITVQRDGQAYTGLVAYSLGNFISNMSQPNVNYGMYITLKLEKQPEGTVRLYEAKMLPTLCRKRSREGRTLHEVLPALENKEWVKPGETLASQTENELTKARDHVLRIAGGDIPPMG